MAVIPFALQWIIPENQLTPLKDSVNEFLKSPSVSSIPGIEYFLTIYPNFDNDKYHGQTWALLYLTFGTGEKKIEAEYTVTIESANYSKKCNDIYEGSCGWYNFNCDTEELFDAEKKFIVDGKFIIKIEGIFKFEDDVSIVVEQKWIGGDLGDELWAKDESKDFTIVADAKEINVHKFILVNRSEVFAAMFNSNMKESKENKVEITDFSFDVVESGIKLMYECNFVTFLSFDDQMSLLQFFDKYDLPKLKDKIENILIDEISASNVCRLSNCSILTNSLKLKEKCIEFLIICVSSKTPVSDIDDLDTDIGKIVLKNSFYRTIVQNS